MAKSNFSKVDEYGFERPPDFNYTLHEEFMSTYLPILANRAKRWSKLLQKNPSLRQNSTLKRYIRKGIPSEHRERVWLATSGANVLREKDKNLYNELLNRPQNKEVVDSIKIDLPRTFPNNIYFAEVGELQGQLFRILTAFSVYNVDIGYCQGLNYIAGLLLLATKNEESSFWLLLTIIEKLLPQNFYTKSMSGLITDINTFEKLIETVEPRINQHFKTLGISWPVVLTKWFICLYVEVLPVETVLRVWDCFFSEGNKILFRTSLTLIRRHQNEILDAKDFPAIIDCFKSMVIDREAVNCSIFIKNIFKETLSRKTIEELRRTASPTVAR